MPAKALFPVAIVGVASAGAAIGLGIPASQHAAPAVERQVSFGFCHAGGGTNCVVDGDTIWLDGVKIRIADIDTPETHEAKCAAEKALGDRATARMHDLVNSGSFSVQKFGSRDEDRYGRKLRILVRDGQSLGDMLVDEGLARRWTGRREPWC